MYLVNVYFSDGRQFGIPFTGMPQGSHQAIVQSDGAIILLPSDAVLVCRPVSPPPVPVEEVAAPPSTPEPEPEAKPEEGWDAGEFRSQQGAVDIPPPVEINPYVGMTTVPYVPENPVPVPTVVTTSSVRKPRRKA